MAEISRHFGRRVTMCESDLCWAVYVHGQYQHFIPIYIASVLRSYPETFVKVFLEGTVLHQDAIQHLRRHVSDRYEIRENWNPLTVNRWEYKRAARWFIPSDDFVGFRYGYIGDVDILVLRKPA